MTIENPFSHSVEAVLGHLDVERSEGLSQKEAEARKLRFGPNQLRGTAKKTAFSIILHQINSIVVWLLMAAAGLSAVMSDIPETIAIIVVLLINTTIGFVTELRASRSMEALLSIAQVSTRVRRSGQVKILDAQELVPGDIVLFGAGDIPTADMRIVESSNLHCDESSLTGESVPVKKSLDPVAQDAVLGDRTSMLFKGTAVTQGAGEAVVTATGMDSEIGKIAHLTQEAKSEAPPLEKRLDRLGRRLVWLTLIITAFIIILGTMRGHDVATMVQTGVALAVASIPEGLPIVATLCLARGMLRMVQHNALISRLSSVETLGATTLIVTDKTGTLTENRMEVVRYVLPDGIVDFKPESAQESAENNALNWALCVGENCTTADRGDALGSTATGDPMELAMLFAARDAKFNSNEFCGIGEPLSIHAFDPERLMMATVHAQGDGFLYLVKGAPEEVISQCSYVMGQDGPEKIDQKEKGIWTAETGKAAAGGLRSLALATKFDLSPDSDPYDDLALVGLVCFADPLRADVPAAIAACTAAGINVVMMTGDHPETAKAIASQATIGEADPVVIEGKALAEFDPEDLSTELSDRIRAARVFARVAPATKLALVSFFQKEGNIVAMTGDGVNDAPALKKADIGVAMGQRGTQVAREASDMVLLDDAFSTIVEAVTQGRIIFKNIRKFVVYLMSCNASEVMVVGLAVGVGLPAPLLPLQILFLNLVTDIFPAFALGFGKGDATVMQDPPRDPSESIIDRGNWIRIGMLGGVIALSTLLAFVLALSWLQLETAQAITVAFLTISLAQLWNVFNVREVGTGLFLNDVTRNPYVWMALALCMGLVLAAIWVPTISDVLRLPSPGPNGFLLAFCASVVPLAAGQILVGIFNPKSSSVLRQRSVSTEK